MVASAKKVLTPLDLDHNILYKARIMTDAFSSATVGELRYNTTAEVPAWWTNAGAEKKITDITLNTFAAPTASVSLNSQKITNLGTPTDPTDATTKAYVDAIVQGLDVKNSVRVATTANLVATRVSNVLTADANGALVVDGVTMAVSDRILVKEQTTGADNGIYLVTDAGSAGTPFILTRTEDANSSVEVTAGMFTFVTEGTVNFDSGWVLNTNDAITLNTTSLSFTQFSGAGSITAGAGLTKTGNTLDVVSANTGIVANANDIELFLNATASGLAISSGLMLADSVAGAGLTVASKVLAVGAGNGITVNADDVALATTTAGAGLTYTTGVLDVVSGNTGIVVNANDITLTLATNSGLSIASGLLVASSIAGTGLTLTAGVLDVVAGEGITSNANDVTLDLMTDSGLVKNVGTGSKQLAINDDDSTLTVASNVLKVKDAGITGTQLNTSVAGGGLTGGGGSALAVGAGTGITVNANDVAIDTTIVPRRYAVSVGDTSATDFVITHSFGTRDVMVQVWETSGAFEEVFTDMELTSTNTVTVKFTTAPTTNQYRVVVLG